MNERICHLILAGKSEPAFQGKGEGDIVIAVDGGYEKCIKLGVKPDAFVGDCDSLGYTPDCPSVIKLNTDKDLTDTMAAVDEGFRRGCRSFRLYSALGGRVSHSLGNLGCLLYIMNKGGEGTITEKDMTIGILDRPVSFGPEHKGKYLSVIPVNEKVKVDITGCRYSGSFEIFKDSTVGISNVIECEARLSRSEGYAYYILENIK